DAKKHRAGIADKNEVEGAWRRLPLGLRETAAGQSQRRQQRDQAGTAHATSSWMAREPWSVRRIGRPTLDIFGVVGSRPSARQTVARRSGPLPARPALVSPLIPSALVRP